MHWNLRITFPTSDLDGRLNWGNFLCEHHPGLGWDRYLSTSHALVRCSIRSFNPARPQSSRKHSTPPVEDATSTHSLSLNLTNKLRPLTYTNPFPSSNTPLIHIFSPSVFSTQLLHSTTPGIGTGRSYVIDSSAVAHPSVCTNTGVPSVSSKIVAMRPPWAKLVDVSIGKFWFLVFLSRENLGRGEGRFMTRTYLGVPPPKPSPSEKIWRHSPGPVRAEAGRGAPVQRSGWMKPL